MEPPPISKPLSTYKFSSKENWLIPVSIWVKYDFCFPLNIVKLATKDKIITTVKFKLIAIFLNVHVMAMNLLVINTKYNTRYEVNVYVLLRD